MQHNSVKVVQAIKKIYPEIEGGYMYWETKQDMSDFEDPIDGLIWENDKFPKPQWKEIESKFYEIDLDEAKQDKIQQVTALRDLRMSKDILGKVGSDKYYFQRNITSNLAWINNIEGEDVAVTNWVTSDNSIIDITKAELLNICAHIRSRDTQAVVQGRLAKNKIQAMTEISEIEKFDIQQIFEAK